MGFKQGPLKPAVLSTIVFPPGTGQRIRSFADDFLGRPHVECGAPDQQDSLLILWALQHYIGKIRLYSNLIGMLSEKSGRKMHKRSERFFKQGLDACPHSFSGEDIR